MWEVRAERRVDRVIARVLGSVVCWRVVLEVVCVWMRSSREGCDLLRSEEEAGGENSVFAVVSSVACVLTR